MVISHSDATLQSCESVKSSSGKTINLFRSVTTLTLKYNLFVFQTHPLLSDLNATCLPPGNNLKEARKGDEESE